MQSSKACTMLWCLLTCVLSSLVVAAQESAPALVLHEKLAAVAQELKELQNLREREQQELHGLKGVIASLQQNEEERRLTATPSAVEDLQGLHRAIVSDVKKNRKQQTVGCTKRVVLSKRHGSAF